jgi:DNA-directed RNA polymerase beta subunit
MEDAIVLNKGSLDRGVGRSFYFRPYSAIEMNYTGGLKDEIVVPEKDISGYKTEEAYKLLELVGIPFTKGRA